MSNSCDITYDKLRKGHISARVFVLAAAFVLIMYALNEPVNAAGMVTGYSATDAGYFLKVASHKDYRYRKVVKNGVVYYCQKEATTGTHLTKSDVCFTEEQMEKMEQSSQDAVRDMQRPAYDGTAQNNGAGT